MLFPQDEWTYPSAFIHLLNDGRNTQYHNNVTVRPDGLAITTRDVPAYDFRVDHSHNGDSELCWDYQDSYWKMMAELAAKEKRKLRKEGRDLRAKKRARV